VELGKETSVQMVMNKKIFTINEEQTVYDASLRLTDQNVGALGVTNSAGKLIGIFSERDLLKRVVAKDLNPKTTLVKQVMTSPVESVPNDASLHVAMLKMSDNHIRHLPVMNTGGDFIGMLGIRDVMSALMQEVIDNFMKRPS
jgi:CBS domain-containing protein